MVRNISTLLILLSFVLPIAANSQSAQPASSSAKVTTYTLPPDKLERAKALYTTETRLLPVDIGYTLLVLFLLIVVPVARRFRDIAERRSRRRIVQALIFVPLFLLTLKVLLIPGGIYGHHLRLQYGLSVQGWASWLGDWAKGLALEIIVGTFTIWGLYRVIQASPRRWWFFFWLLSVPFVAFTVFIYPVLIAPLYDHFEPLQAHQPQLVQEIEKVVQRGGLSIPPSRMFEMRASDKVTTLNAYVTGFGATKRVVVYDNTSKALTIPETLYVFGHEMGHYVLGHIWKGLAFTAVMLLVTYYLGYLLVTWILRKWKDRWDIRSVNDWASLPVLLMIVFVLGLITGPLDSWYSRMNEHDADVYGLEVIHGLVPDPNQVAAHCFQILGERSLDYPYPNHLLVWWMYDHPTISDRVRFVVNYDPWNKGESPQFVK
jgi:STE24 endopeptidase